MKNLLVLLVLSLGSVLSAQDIVIDGIEGTSWANPSWRLVRKELAVNKKTPYLYVEVEGNCHYEYEQECTPKPNGGVDCHTVPKWTCDYDSKAFTLPKEVVVKGKEVRYQKDDLDIKLGKLKSFLFWKWVKTEDYVGIFTDIKSAKLIIRDQKDVKAEVQFQELYKLNPEVKK
ncbi:MAG: hypothetical protein KC646_00625 [Candidatus Cloacimonetes bacterium]|nr:hypothetical protein [Candidatus Cloacimonadota bacterium]